MAFSVVVDEEGAPVEVAQGRGDLRRTSMPSTIVPIRRGLSLVDKHVSFARLFAEQPLVGGVAGWLLRQSLRVPLKAYRRDGDESRRRLAARDHPLGRAIVEPDERMSQAQLVQALLGSFLVHGNALARHETGARERLRFKPKDWRYSFPMMPWRDSIVGWELDTDLPDAYEDVACEQVLHVAAWSPLSLLGISPLQQLGTTITIEDAAQRHQRSMLSNGARPPSAIEMNPDFLNLKPDERKAIEDQLREDVEDIYTGPENGGRPALLPPGLTWKQVGHTAVEAELIAQRVVARTEAIAVYGITPAAIGVVERSSELNEQRQMAYTDGLAPPLILIEQTINAQVVTPIFGDEYFVEFDFAGILRGDRLKEIEALREAIASALLTPNEGRAVLNAPQSDVPAMNEFYLPYNNLWPVAQPPPQGRQGRSLEQAPTSSPSGYQAQSSGLLVPA